MKTFSLSSNGKKVGSIYQILCQLFTPLRGLSHQINHAVLIMIMTLLVLFSSMEIYAQDIKKIHDQIVQDNNLNFVQVTRGTNQITLNISYGDLKNSIDSSELGYYITMEQFGGK